MSLPPIFTDPSSFGKDSYVPFLGQVEDVDDPKRSGRVKVRCLGWHPVEKEGEGLSTEQLPWARTLMPVTHAQQNRSGGKHGLIPGSMVVGFFLDGNDANDPVVIGAFNHTAKASEENNREDLEVGEGTISSSTPGYTKGKPDYIEPNTGLYTQEELEGGSDDPNDQAHDVPALDDSTNGECQPEPSAFGTKKLEEKSSSNTLSQNVNITIGDGQCGTLMNGRANISAEISELLPSGLGDIVDGSGLFDISGNAININAIINKLSMKIAGILKGALHAKKSEIQKMMNKKMHSMQIFTAASRSPLTAELADLGMSMQFDMFNSIMDQFIGQIESQITESIQSLFNQMTESKTEDNSTGESGTTSSSPIKDFKPIEVADAVIIDVDSGFNLASEKATKETEEKMRDVNTAINNFNEKLGNISMDDFECEEDVNDEIQKDYDEVVNIISPVLPDFDDSSDSGSGGGGGDMAGMLQQVLQMDFTQLQQIFNKSGLGVLTDLTKEGCNPHDLYNTIQGYAGSMGGVGGQSTGGGSESGKSSKNHKDTYPNVGLSGIPQKESTPDKGTKSPLLGSPRKKKIKQSQRKKIINGLPQFTPVDYYQELREYGLFGEIQFDGIMTNNDRVLVNNQVDPSMNGIYVTGKGPWKRAKDAEKGSQFKRKKIVFVNSMDKTEGAFYYSGTQTPKIGHADIEFKSVMNSDEFTRKEKDAFNHQIETEPDGTKGNFFCVSVPSSDKKAATNYVYGAPNAIVVNNPGENYFFESKKAGRNYPSVFIDRYAGTPRPVVDPNSGELVAVLINYNSFDMKKSDPSTSIFPDDSSIGISTEDPLYDVILDGFYIANTGINYSQDTTISVIDKDRELETAVCRPLIRDGRILRVDIINNGTGFKRIPRIKFNNKNKGAGCKLYPIMGLKSRESNPSVKKLEQNVSLSLNQARANVNLYTTIKDVPE